MQEPLAAQEQVNERPTVVPRLREWTGQVGTFNLTAQSRVIINSGSTTTHSSVHGIETTATEAASNLSDELLMLTGISIPVSTAASDTAITSDIVLTLLNSRNSALGDEGYILTIGDSVHVQANTNTGIFYAGRTILQILGQSATLRALPKGVATDFPLKSFRSLMLDMGRKYWQLDYLEDLIRQMAWLKLNVFHMHLTEWNAFRLNSDNYPGLGADGASYSRADIDQLQAVAKEYHVVLLPEIDMPGHATAMVQYYRTANPGQTIGFTHSTCRNLNKGVYNNAPDWNINFANSTARQFAKDILSEFLPWFEGPYVHIGADEAYLPADMRSCQEVIDYAAIHTSSVPGDVLPHFINDMNDHVKSMGKEMYVWNGYEHSSSARDVVDSDVVIYLWDDDETNDIADTINFLNAGYDIVYTRRHSNPNSADFNRYNLYLTPGFALFPTLRAFYNATLSSDDNFRGYQLTVWADSVNTFGDDYFELQMATGRAVLADRLWAAPPSQDVDGLRRRLQAVGDPLSVSLAKAHRGLAKDEWSVHGVTSEGTGEEGRQAFDGQVETIWRSREVPSSGSPQDLDIDLGATYDIDGFQYVPRHRASTRARDGRPRDRVGAYELYVSTDGTTWGTAVETGTVSGAEPTIVAGVLTQVARGRYVRFRVTGSLEESHWVSVAEINLFGTFVRAAPESSYEDSLVTHWNFDEGTGTAVSDSEGTRNGAITDATWIEGHVGSNALRFDGDGDYVQIQAADINNDWTAAMWVRRRADVNSAIIAHSLTSSLKIQQYNSADDEVGYTRNSRLINGIWVRGADHDLGYTAPLNTWIHLVFVRRGPRMELFASGRLVGSVADDPIDLPLNRLGARSDGVDSMNGDLDDIRLYDVALLPEEVASLYASYSDLPPHVCP